MSEYAIRIIVAGGRDFDDYGKAQPSLSFIVAPFVEAGIPVEIVSGGARGADALGEAFAKAWSIPCKVFPADWDKHGRSAGYIRNGEMAGYAHILVAFWDGKSKGTSHMIQTALRAGLEVHVYRYELSDTGKVI